MTVMAGEAPVGLRLRLQYRRRSAARPSQTARRAVSTALSLATVREDRSRSAGGWYLIVDASKQPQVGLFGSSAGSEHPDLTRQSRPDRTPNLWRERRARKRGIERRTLYAWGVGVDALLEHDRAIRQVERADRGSKKRRASAPRLQQCGALTTTCEKQRNRGRTHASADIDPRSHRPQPSRFDQPRRIEKKNLSKLRIGARPGEIGPGAPRFCGLEIGWPPRRHGNTDEPTKLINHQQAALQTTTGTGTVTHLLPLPPPRLAARRS